MGSLTKKNLWIAAGYSCVLIAGLILGPKFASENQNSKNGSFLSFGSISLSEAPGRQRAEEF
jgi:carboxyl-terminal processing protease